jgi:hypothetical protein
VTAAAVAPDYIRIRCLVEVETETGVKALRRADNGLVMSAWISRAICRAIDDEGVEVLIHRAPYIRWKTEPWRVMRGENGKPERVDPPAPVLPTPRNGPQIGDAMLARLGARGLLLTAGSDGEWNAAAVVERGVGGWVRVTEPVGASTPEGAVAKLDAEWRAHQAKEEERRMRIRAGRR